jgi:hypothetical protein
MVNKLCSRYYTFVSKFKNLCIQGRHKSNLHYFNTMFFTFYFFKRLDFPLSVEPCFLEMSNLALKFGWISLAVCYHHISLSMICFYNTLKWYLLYLMTHECEQGSHMNCNFDIRCIKMHDKLLDTRETIP